jgi:hypothetical protein
MQPEPKKNESSTFVNNPSQFPALNPNLAEEAFTPKPTSTSYSKVIQSTLPVEVIPQTQPSSTVNPNPSRQHQQHQHQHHHQHHQQHQPQQQQQQHQSHQHHQHHQQHQQQHQGNNYSSNWVQPSRSLWIGNVDESVTEENLREEFAKFGEIESVRLLTAKTCAFVNFTDVENAVKALQELNGVTVGNVAIKVNFAKVLFDYFFKIYSLHPLPSLQAEDQ